MTVLGPPLGHDAFGSAASWVYPLGDGASLTVTTLEAGQVAGHGSVHWRGVGVIAVSPDGLEKVDHQVASDEYHGDWCVPRAPGLRDGSGCTVGGAVSVSARESDLSKERYLDISDLQEFTLTDHPHCVLLGRVFLFYLKGASYTARAPTRRITGRCSRRSSRTTSSGRRSLTPTVRQKWLPVREMGMKILTDTASVAVGFRGALRNIYSTASDAMVTTSGVDLTDSTPGPSSPAGATAS